MNQSRNPRRTNPRLTRKLDLDRLGELREKQREQVALDMLRYYAMR